MEIIALSRFRSPALEGLFQEENEEWVKNLRWDYGPSLQIIRGLVDAFALSGFVALTQGVPVGYLFYLEDSGTGLIGNCFVSRGSLGTGVEERLLNVAVEALKAKPKIIRIESQFISFRPWPCEGFFHRHGFSCYERYFMTRDCDTQTLVDLPQCDVRLQTWDSSNLEIASRQLALAYEQIIDREISFHYQSVRGCRSFLGGIIEKPGCGKFMQEASFGAWDSSTGEMVGFVLTSTVSPLNGHIPQIVVAKQFQGKGVGGWLLHHAIVALRLKRYRAVSLSVTAQNKSACELYRRFRFDILIRFQTSVWKRKTDCA
jgi:ribosomal protein S18 acetylase RimI-like enzyme